MNPPVPALIVRRILRDPVYAVVAPVMMLLLVVLGCLLWVLELPSRRKRGWRLTWTCAAAFLLDWSVFVRCTWLWCVMPPWRRNQQEWQARHVVVLGQELHRFVQAADRLVGLDLRVRVPAVDPDRPVLLLARHAGTGDSLLMVYVITHDLVRVPRVVLKRALLWDPALDLCLRRLHAYFLGEGMTPQVRDEQLRAFAEHVEVNDATLLFPEGRNWSPGRHASDLAEAIEEGETERAAWLERNPRVLSPRSTGVRRILQARPDSQVLVAGHQGVEDLRSVPDIWRALPLRRQIHIDVRQADSLPDEHIDAWLQDEWERLDDWTDELDGD